MTTVEERLKSAEVELASIRKQVKDEAVLNDESSLPVGSILAGLDVVAVRLRRVHAVYGSVDRKPTDRPVWVTIHGDFSGNSYDSLAALRKSRREFLNYTVVRRGY